MNFKPYTWPVRSGLIGALLTILIVSAFDASHANLNAGTMIGLLVSLAYTAVELVRTRPSTTWTFLSYLAAAGQLFLLGMATTGAFQLYRLVFG